MDLGQGYLSENLKIDAVSGYTAAGTSPITATGVDCAGYDGVMFLAQIGTAADGNYLTAGFAAADSGYTPNTAARVISGTSPSQEILVLDILRPSARFVNAIMTLGTSSTIVGIWAIRYRSRALPVTNTLSGTLVQTQYATG
jgi:hypothetical protein